MSSKITKPREIIVEECERQFEFIQALKRTDFFKRDIGDKDSDTESRPGLELDDNEENEEDDDLDSLVDDGDYEGESSWHDSVTLSKENTSNDLTRDASQRPRGSSTSVGRSSGRADGKKSRAESMKPIDLINSKINKLDGIFSKLDLVKPSGRPESYEIKPDVKTREALALAREQENKEIALFSGVLALKSTFFNQRTEIPPPIVTKKSEEKESVIKKPKLVELYHFPGFDNDNYFFLPHDIQIDDVLRRALDSILILKKQPYYKQFLEEVIFTEHIRWIVSATFWWCYLERYRKTPSLQQKLFKDVSDRYVSLIFKVDNLKYRDTFFKSLPNLLAMFVYTIFCSSFPESYMTQFNDDFREFICEVSYSWISGCKPTPRSYANWNFKMIDPPSAVFAKQVLNDKGGNNIVDEIMNLGTTYQKLTFASKPSVLGRRSQLSESSGRKSKNSSEKSAKSTKSAVSKRRSALVPSDLSDITEITQKQPKTERFFKTSTKKPSHPACRGPEYEECMFDLFGHSPLVDYYLHNNQARKINTAETLVQHQQVTQLPPLNAPTYDDVIKESVKRMHKMKKAIKESHKKNLIELCKLEKSHVREMRDFEGKCDNLLANKREVSFISDLIVLDGKRDPNTKSFAVNAAIRRSFDHQSPYN